jgi:hypothetical protein
LAEELLSHPLLKAEAEKLLFSRKDTIETSAAAEAISSEMQAAMMMEVPLRSLSIFGDVDLDQLKYRPFQQYSHAVIQPIVKLHFGRLKS